MHQKLNIRVHNSIIIRLKPFVERSCSVIVVPEVRKLLIASRFRLPVNRVIFDIDVELPVHRGVFFVFGCLGLRFRFFGGCRHVGGGFWGIVSVLGEYQRSAHCAGNSFLHGTYKETRFMIGKYCSRGWLQVSQHRHPMLLATHHLASTLTSERVDVFFACILERRRLLLFLFRPQRANVAGYGRSVCVNRRRRRSRVFFL